ncbi:MAG: aspartate kinase [Thermotogae bacterium]|nr:aspartate kinase [Thermotogota bacterium]
MTPCVLKFGGSSVATPQRIKDVARLIKDKAETCQPVVVVSAMGKTTDELLRLAKSVSPSPPPRELDMLLTVGERISMALLSMALHDLGLKAVSFTGSQVGIITENKFNRARVLEIKLYRILDALRDRKIPVVAGFQGVSLSKEITTLGRGGSDLTAIALAISLGKVPCEIYTDVPGVFALDPHDFPSARRYDRLDYGVLSEMASSGAKVMHARAVNLAAKYNLPFLILSSYEPEMGGTLVERREHLESPGVKAITTAKVLMLDVEGKEGVPLLIRMIGEVRVLNFSHDTTGKHLVFFVPEEEGDRALKLLSELGLRFSMRGELSLVCVIGWGVGTSPEIGDTLFATVGWEHIFMMSSSDMKICIVVERERERAIVERLAKRFNLLDEKRSFKGPDS